MAAAGGNATTVAIATGISTATVAGASKYVPIIAVPPTWAKSKSKLRPADFLYPIYTM
jgi:hypothetical protein